MVSNIVVAILVVMLFFIFSSSITVSITGTCTNQLIRVTAMYMCMVKDSQIKTLLYIIIKPKFVYHQNYLWQFKWYLAEYSLQFYMSKAACGRWETQNILAGCWQ